MENILLTGIMGVGKSEIAKILGWKYGYTRYSMADWLKNTIHNHYGLVNPKKSDKIKTSYGYITVREAYQKFGTQCIRKFDNNWHIEELISSIKKTPFVIDDIRFSNEIEHLTDKYKCKIINITCEEKIRVIRICQRDGLVPDDSINNHISENNDLNYDYIIDTSQGYNNVEYQLKMILDKISI